MHLGGRCYSRVELLTSKGAERSTVASAADCEVEAESLTAGHKRKHNACRAELEVVLVVIPDQYPITISLFAVHTCEAMPLSPKNGADVVISIRLDAVQYQDGAPAFVAQLVHDT